MMAISPLKSKLKQIPAKPGIYFWLDKKGRVIYVGRATSLKSRLSQYFRGDIGPRIAEMVSVATDLQYQETETLLQAIILEAKNIKKYWPKYNIVDRDDRSFIYIVITDEKYPKPLIVRGRDLEKFPTRKNRVFGPYQSYHLLRSALRLIRRIFPYSTCRSDSGRACFNYQIGLCPGVCIGAISQTDYKKNIKNIILLLSGEHKRLYQKLIKENPDQLKALKHIQDVSLLTKEDNLAETRLNRLEGYDISHHQGKESYGSMVVFENGLPASNQYRLFKIREAPPGDDERALKEILLRRFKHLKWPKPELIMIDGGRPQISFLSKILQKHNISIPLVGISKFGGDKLVFSVGTKQSWRALAENIKPTLLKIREEAHRFANYGRKRGSRIKK